MSRSILHTFLGALLRERSARHRFDEAQQMPGTFGAEASKWLADTYAVLAESIDGLDRWRRVYRLACTYPITWAIAAWYEERYGERAGAEIERCLMNGREPRVYNEAKEMGEKP